MAPNTVTLTLSPNEAACVTGVPLKQVHRIIDAGLLDEAAIGQKRSRAVRREGLVGLKLAHETTDMLTLAGRRRLVRYLLKHPRARAARARDVSVDLQTMKGEVNKGLSTLARARDAVVCDQAVLSGIPCIKGTRIPAHDIADMLANGDSVENNRRRVPATLRDADRVGRLLRQSLSPAGSPSPRAVLAHAPAVRVERDFPR